MNKIGFNFLLEDEEIHSIEKDFICFKFLGHTPQDMSPCLKWTEKDKIYVDQLLPNNKFIQMHPVAKHSYKHLGMKTCAQIIDYLHENGYEVVLTGSPNPDDQKALAELCEYSQIKAINLCGKLSLTQMGYLSEKAEYYLGCDTAPMHIAACVDTPVITWFGPTIPLYWGPWDSSLKQNTYKREGGIQTMGKHTIIQKKLECSPCGKEGCDNTHTSKCLDELSFGEIKKILEDKIPKLDKSTL